MKKTILASALLASMFGLTACSSDNEQTAPNEAPVAINLTATAGSIDITTRAASTAISGTTLAQNSEIAVYMPESSIGNAAKLTYTNAAALDSEAKDLTLKVTTPAQSIPYFVSTASIVNIYGAYPAANLDASASVKVTHTVNTDQSENSNYQSSDLLYAKTSATKDKVASVSATLPFYHMMPKIIVNVTNNTGANITSISLKNVNTKLEITPTADYVYGYTTWAGYTAKGFASSEPADVKVYDTETTGNVTNECALIAPQTITVEAQSTKDFIWIVTSQGTAKFALNATKDFLPGNSYSVAITISGTSFDLKGTITDWATGTVSDLPTNVIYTE